MTCRTDMTIEGVIRDPIIAAVLRADRVDPHGFEVLLRSAQRRLAAPRVDAPPVPPPATLQSLAASKFRDRPCA